MTPRSLLLLASLGLAPPAAVAAAGDPPPFERSELREDCDRYEPLRQPFFGDLHTHTAFSFDSYAFENRNEPDDAYAFAEGQPVGLAPLDAEGQPTRSLQLERALDFAAVTDHAELFGEVSICTRDPVPPFEPCLVLDRASPGAAFLYWAQALAGSPPERFAFCGEDGLACVLEAASVWQRVQAAAEAHYDRQSTCRFTTFDAYEWTGGTAQGGLHRNVVFRNDRVPALSLSSYEVQDPEGLREALFSQCLAADDGCDVIAIPHNPNLSGGRMFDPTDANGELVTPESASLRALLEPLVEIVQHKGDSECRTLVGTSDELCDFEKVADVPPAEDAPSSYVRNAIGIGLEVESQIGVNPFRFGFVGSTDNHNGTPGAAEESAYRGHVGALDAAPADRLTGQHARFNPGGLAVLWAEENSRDSLFAAMRRRESYATTGTRPTLRFFGGAGYPQDLCDRGDFALRGYALGVPMGGAVRQDEAPVFAVSALMDPGTPGRPGTPLQRIQIVKLWLEDGAARERVFDVAGTVDNGWSVDPLSCETSGGDSPALCAVWSDPEFDPADPPELAAYYARVLENPTCRWSAFLCRDQQVDCEAPPPGLEDCCDGSLPATIQERAVTSPIWYLPEPGGAPALLAGASGLLALARRRRSAARQP